MKKTMKKVLAFVLTVLMCVSVALPVVAADAATCPGADVKHTKKNCSTYTEVEKVAVACGTNGYTIYKCTTCSTYFDDDIVPFTTPHEEKPGATVVGDCTKEGYKVCKHCNQKYDFDYNSNGGKNKSGSGHKYADFKAANKGVNKPWYPITEGQVCAYTHYESRCTNEWNGKRCTAKTTKPYDGNLENHKWKLVEDKSFVAPTCVATGSGTFECTVCATTKTLVIDAVGHTLADYTEDVAYKAPTCTEDGNQAGKACPVCKAIRPSDVLKALHDVDVRNNETGADGADGYADCFTVGVGREETCDVAGYNVIYCPTCQMTEAEVIPAKGHNRGKVVETVAPTCKDPGKIVYEQACDRCSVGPKEEIIPVATGAHTLVFKTYEASCEYVGHTQYECTVCGYVDLDSVVNTTTAKNPDNHVWEWTETLPATCTTTGSKTATCKYCHTPNPETETIPATGHKFYEVVDGKADYTNSDKRADVAPNCVIGDGYESYACMVCGAYNTNATAGPVVEHKRPTKALKYNPNNLDHHNGGVCTQIGSPVVGSCTTAGYTIYLCEAGTTPHSVTVYDPNDGFNGKHQKPTTPWNGKTGAEDNGGYQAKVDASCDNPNTKAKEGTGYDESYKCAKCQEWVGVYRDAKGNLVDAKGKASTTAVRITHANLTHENLVAAKAPTCTADGHWATWNCSKCNTSYTAEGVYTFVDADGVTQTQKIKYVRPALVHGQFNKTENWTDAVVDAGSETSWAVRYSVTATTCGTNQYVHSYCTLCKVDKIHSYNFVEHVWALEDTKTEATCGEGAYVLCTNNCGTKNYLSEKLGHIDADGNIIKCAPKGTIKCTRCTPTAETYKETHNFKNTYVAPTCSAYGYNLFVCEDCEMNYHEDLPGDKQFAMAPHTWKVVNNKPYQGAAEGWYITTAAKPGTAGVLTRTCDVCNKTETKNYGDALYVNISMDNGVVAGAQLVNSGLLKVTLKTSAAKLNVWGMSFRLDFDHDILAYEKFVVLNSAFKDSTIVSNYNSVVETNPNPDDKTFVDLPESVNVVMTAPNTTAGAKQNVVLDGNLQGLVEVYFRVLGDCVYDLGTGLATAQYVNVNIFDADVVEYNADGDIQHDVDVVDSENETATATTYAEGTIKVLGDVTGDVELTTPGKIATMLDASALMEIYTKNGKYNAMADIDKNGKVDLADFAALMTFIADGKYNVLVANGVN